MNEENVSDLLIEESCRRPLSATTSIAVLTAALKQIKGTNLMGALSIAALIATLTAVSIEPLCGIQS